MEKKHSVVYVTDQVEEAERNLRKWDKTNVFSLIIFAITGTIFVNSNQQVSEILNGSNILLQFLIHILMMSLFFVPGILSLNESDEKMADCEMASNGKFTFHKFATILISDLHYVLYFAYLLSIANAS